MIKKAIDKLFHPAIIALLFTFIVVLFLPPQFNKYQAKIIETKTIHQPDVYSYYDLNSDRYSEEMYYHGPPAKYPSLIIRNSGKVVDQKNFKGDFVSGDFFIYCDYDSDSVAEIFVITMENDSIFLTGVNPFSSEEFYFIKLFIDKCSKYDGKYDCQAFFCDTPDTDNNGYKEMIFEVNTGRTKQPRNLYLVDIYNGTVIKSPESGTAMQEPICFDINDDGFNEYLGESLALGNFHVEDSIDYPDIHAWLMVLDRNMKFIFEPKKFGQYKTNIDVKPFCPYKNKYLVVFQKHQGTENIDSKLILLDSKGHQINERLLEDFSDIENSFLISGDKIRYNNLYLFLSNGQTEQIDSSLNPIRTITLPKILYVRPSNIDIDADGMDEFIFSQEEQQGIIITRNDFSHPVLIEFPHGNSVSSARYFSLIHNGDAKPNLYFQANGRGFIIKYSKNTLYQLKYLIWILIYGVIFMLLFLLQKVQNIRARKKFEMEQRLAKLQLKSIKGQTDPHFTLNLIDSIGNLFYKQDSEKAAYVFGKYAKLLRTTILSSENISVSLEKEIEYVKNYMDLEKFRYDDKFNYNIEIDKNVNSQIEIPKMLIHTFIENSIKHGLKHKEGIGELSISFKKQEKSINVKIRDNGIGRKLAKEYSKLSTGKGLRILDNMLELYFNLRKSKITYQLTDLYMDDGQPDGTLATIIIPLKTRK